MDVSQVPLKKEAALILTKSKAIKMEGLLTHFPHFFLIPYNLCTIYLFDEKTFEMNKRSMLSLNYVNA